MYKTKKGAIEVICGNMYSDKSSTLIRRLKRFAYAQKTIKVFKPKLDDRYSEDKIVTHEGIEFDAITVEKPQEIRNKILANMQKFPDVVAIDEVQFFDYEIIEVIEELANAGIYVIVAGLDQDFRGEPFRVVADLLARAEFITKLSSICVVCGEAATKSQRLIDGKAANLSEPTILIGGNETYEPRCREHFETGKD